MSVQTYTLINRNCPAIIDHHHRTYSIDGYSFNSIPQNNYMEQHVCFRVQSAPQGDRIATWNIDFRFISRDLAPRRVHVRFARAKFQSGLRMGAIFHLYIFINILCINALCVARTQDDTQQPSRITSGFRVCARKQPSHEDDSPHIITRRSRVYISDVLVVMRRGTASKDGIMCGTNRKIIRHCVRAR